MVFRYLQGDGMVSGIIIPIICPLLISTLAPDVLHVGEEGCMDPGMDLIRLGSHIRYVKLHRKIDKHLCHCLHERCRPLDH